MAEYVSGFGWTVKKFIIVIKFIFLFIVAKFQINVSFYTP